VRPGALVSFGKALKVGLGALCTGLRALNLDLAGGPRPLRALVQGGSRGWAILAEISFIAPGIVVRTLPLDIAARSPGRSWRKRRVSDACSDPVGALGSSCRRLLIAQFAEVACMEFVQRDDVLRRGIAAYSLECSSCLPGMPDPARPDGLLVGVSHVRAPWPSEF
jgi:hypothetical protein